MLREEGPGSIVKKLHDNDMADQARNDLKDYQTRSNENYLELLNQIAELIHLSVSWSD